MKESVLILDDDVAVCSVLARVLSDSSYEVSTTCSVAQAQETAEKQRFDAYVLDYRLPDGSGLDLARRLREKGTKAPIILMSGYGPSDLAEKAAKCGVSEIVEKPFSKKSICDTLQNSLEKLASEALFEAPLPDVSSATSENPRRRTFGWPKWNIFGSRESDR